jgi:Outer membrane protein beta-barrel domain
MSRSSSKVGTFACFVAGFCLAAPATAFAQADAGAFSFNLSAGWAQLQTDDESLLDDQDGWYLDSDFGWRVGPGFWLALGFTGSYYSADEEFSTGGAFPTEVDISADLSLFAIEPRIRYVFQTGDGGPGLYVAPRIGAGLLIADLEALDVVEGPGGGFTVSGEDETEFGFEVRPAIEVGFSGGAWAVGAEASYMLAWIDAGSAGDTLEELRAGIFFRVSY